MKGTDLPIQRPASGRFERPRHYGPLLRFDGHARTTGTCGDTMDVWLKASEGHITGIGFTTDGCGPSRAAGSVAMELAMGKLLTEAARIEPADILAALGGLPDELQHCALLASNTLKAAIAAFGRKDR